ncbi:MAG TPA: SpoIIIAH-like family protein [Candidatus Merdenecus merdavium]|nr:SpoIIIAH-like family protein [Candidatus Merdenecus merdavium]
MKNIFKKNQIVVTALAIMLAVAGYLSYSGTKLGVDDKSKEAANQKVESGVKDVTNDEILSENDMQEESTDETETNELLTPTDGNVLEDIDSLDLDISDEDLSANAEDEDTTSPGQAVLASGSGTNIFSAGAKVEREQVRAKNKETLLEVINNENITEDQKQNAINNMLEMTDIAEKEAAAEILLEAKGFMDVVVNITDESVDVVVNMAEIDDAGRAQIEDIVKRKTGISAENIIISPVTVEE